MSLQACADLVAKGDPDRFQAAMAVPVSAREKLFPIYAFNVEVARGPWVASEPMIGEMRLQWWRDALDEIKSGEGCRKHEVTTPLAGVLTAEDAEALDRLVAARRWDLYTDTFEDAEHFDDYLDATGGTLMWVAARSIGATEEQPYRILGRASALANLFLAVPQLESRGRKPVVDGRPEALRALSAASLDSLSGLRLPKNGRAASIAAWRTRTILKRATSDPNRIANGTLAESEMLRRWSLFRAAWGL